jgi:hypothetical protein
MIYRWRYLNFFDRIRHRGGVEGSREVTLQSGAATSIDLEFGGGVGQAEDGQVGVDVLQAVDQLKGGAFGSAQVHEGGPDVFQLEDVLGGLCAEAHDHLAAALLQTFFEGGPGSGMAMDQQDANVVHRAKHFRF